jgi:hypothetical protein
MNGGMMCMVLEKGDKLPGFMKPSAGNAKKATPERRPYLVRTDTC